MKINAPCIITPRLLPGVKIGDSFLSIDYTEWMSDGRQGYIVYLDTPEAEHTIDDISSGVGGGSLQGGLKSCLSFMGACAESRDYAERTGLGGENADLFSEAVGQWCQANQDGISMLCGRPFGGRKSDR